MKNTGSRAGIILLSLAVLGLPGCRSQRLYMLENLPPLAQIVVDGRAEDWRGSLSMIEGGDASLGVANDEQNLHWAACRPWEAARGGTGAADREATT